MKAFRFAPTRPSGAIALAVVLAQGVAGLVLAQEAPSAPKPADKTTQAEVQASGMTVAIDPQTKQIRPPTPEEVRALTKVEKAAAMSQNLRTTQLTIRQHPGGMTSALLPESYMETLTVTKQPSGALSFQCASEKDKPPGMTSTSSAATHKTVSSGAGVAKARLDAATSRPKNPAQAPKLEEK